MNDVKREAPRRIRRSRRSRSDCSSFAARLITSTAARFRWRILPAATIAFVSAIIYLVLVRDPIPETRGYDPLDEK